MLKTLFRRCKKYKLGRQKLTVDPTTSYSDNLVDSAVTVYPIHIDYEEE